MAKIEKYPWAAKEAGKTIYDFNFMIKPYQK